VENIRKFCEETGFNYKVGECGIGRPCVGINANEHWVSYDLLDGPNYKSIGEHKGACESAPATAYHKYPCLAVLMSETTPENITVATKELDDWIKSIMEAGYQKKPYRDCGGINALMGGKILEGIVDVEENKS